MSNFNDVHLAKVSKIQRSADISKTSATVSINSRRMEKSIQESQYQSDIRRQKDDEKYVFGNISPRGGAAISAAQEVESPDHTQRDTNESDNNISSCSTLDIGKVENLSLHQLEMQVRDLSQRLRQAEEQRTDVQRQLQESNAEKELCFRRLEVVSAAHECRITEMHCVIAELSKKLRAKQESTILEEQEPEHEGSEISFQDGSIYNSELNMTNPDAECQTDPLDGGDYSTGEGIIANAEEQLDIESNVDIKIMDSAYKGQVEALQEEVLHLKAQIALLQSEIANPLHMRPEHDNVVVEEQQSFEYFNGEVETNENNCTLNELHFAYNTEQKLNNLNAATQAEVLVLPTHCETVTSPQKKSVVPKMAERVKLRCASKHTPAENITATDLLSGEIKHAEIVDQLVADLKHNNSMLDCYAEPNQLDNELKLLQRKVEHLKMRNTVLCLTLDECKEHCDHLYLLCGKYESNAIALQLAVNCSDRAIEAYDVMLALLESKLALIKDKSIAAEDSRKAVESVARHLLDRFESEKSVCENSLGPWQNTFSIPDKACAPWTSEDDNRLRYHVSKLKGRRSTVQNTIVNLESPFSDLYEKSRLTLESSKDLQQPDKSAQLDIEMAILMQELLNLREENISLKTKIDDATIERQYAMERASILEDALKQLTTDSNSLFEQEKRFVAENRTSYSEAEHDALTEQQLVEALTRESELKGRIQALIASVSASQKISDEKYEQLHSNIAELQKSNLNLSQLLEQNKRKYQSRTRKLEQKIMELSLELGRQAGCYRGSSVAGSGSITAVQRKPLKGDPEQSARLFDDDNVPETTL